MVPMTQITAEFLWINHRAVLGGDNARSGADGRPLKLPYLLEEAPPGVQEAHWGMAAAVALANGQELPPRPVGVSEERAAEIVRRLDVKVTVGG